MRLPCRGFAGAVLLATLPSIPCAVEAGPSKSETPKSETPKSETPSTETPQRHGDGSSTASPELVLVLPTKVAGLSDEWSQTLTARITELVDAEPRWELLNLGELGELLALEEDRRRIDCETSPACWAKIRDASHAAKVLSSSLGSVGSNIVLTVTLVDTQLGRVVGRASETVAKPEELLEAALPLVTNLAWGVFGGSSPGRAQHFRLPPGQKTSFAIVDLRSGGTVTAATAATLTQVLSAQLGAIQGASVVTGDDVASMLQLEEQKERLGCTEDSSCLAEVGGALGVDKLVVGQIGDLAGRFVISLRLIDVKNARVESRVTEVFSANQDQLIAALRHSARRLVGVSSDEPGALAITSPHAGVDILIDEIAHGTLPRPPLLDLSSGQHALRLSKPGYYEWYSDVFVEPAGMSAVWVEMQQKPARWPFWSSVAATAAVGLAAVVVGGTSEYYESRARDLYASKTRPAARARYESNARTLNGTANVLFISTGVLAVVAASIAFGTDWSE